MDELFDLFSRLSDLAPEERERELREIAARNPELHAQLRGLLESPETEFETEPSLFGWQSEHARQPLGDYLLQEEIGRGGGGAVYRAVRLDRPTEPFAIKILDGNVNHDQRSRFEREQRILLQLDHPNLVKLLEFGTTPLGSPYFVMPLINGSLLEEYLDTHPRTVQEQVTLFKAIVAGVAHAHQSGIVHRDLTYRNLLIDSEGNPIILDFGIALLMERVEATITREHQTIGTPGCMAPEQFSSDLGQSGPTIDIFALGILFYRILSGERAFRAILPWQSFIEVSQKEPPSLRSKVPSLPQELEWICQKCLRKAPHERYPDAGELLADLGRFEAGKRVVARPPNLVQRTRQWIRHNPYRAGLLLLIILVATVGFPIALVLREQAKEAQILAEGEQTESLRLARETLNAVRRNSPQGNPIALQPYREQLLNLFEFMQKLELRRPNDLSLARELIEVESMLAYVEMAIASRERAVELYRDAARRLEPLIRAEPNSLELLQTQLRVQANLGWLLMIMDRLEEAETPILAAIETTKRRREIREETADDQYQRLNIYDTLAELLLEAKQPENIQRFLPEWRRELEAILRQSDTPALRGLSGRFHRFDAEFAAMENDWKRAEQAIVRADAIYADLVQKRDPQSGSDIGARSDWYQIRSIRGEILRASGRVPEALKLLLEVETDQRNLMRTAPTLIQFRRDWALTQLRLGRLFREQKQAPEARTRLLEARDTLEKKRKDNGEDRHLNRLLAELQSELEQLK
jgi:tRNA A-37 threonylcarbamoyl transferase component Bud32/tetratricopeptide (TPR) repeat protein